MPFCMRAKISAAAVAVVVSASSCGLLDSSGTATDAGEPATVPPSVTTINPSNMPVPGDAASGTSEGDGGGGASEDGAGSQDMSNAAEPSGDEKNLQMLSSDEGENAADSSADDSASTSDESSEDTNPAGPIDPMSASCPALLSSADIASALGTDLPQAHERIEDVADEAIELTGKVRCYYGTAKIADSKPLVVAFAQYSTADAAKAQAAVTIDAERDKGASQDTGQVGDLTATILVRDGGLMIVRDDAMTVSIGLASDVVAVDAVPDALTNLGAAILARIGA